jgi:branched-chain amino acid transport system substrate-binding protein
VTGFIVYERDKTNFRSEIDQVMRSRSDTVMLNGYLPDTTILLRELYRAGFDGRKFTFAYAAPPSIFQSLPNEVTNGLITFQPSPDVGSDAYKRLAARFGSTPVDPYSAQTNDHATLAILAAALAGDAAGTAIRDNVRKISQGDGEKVTNVTDGLKAIAAGKAVNYEGASGPVEFDDKGDIRGTKFRFEVAEGGAFKVLEIV